MLYPSAKLYERDRCDAARDVYDPCKPRLCIDVRGVRAVGEGDNQPTLCSTERSELFAPKVTHSP